MKPQNKGKVKLYETSTYVNISRKYLTKNEREGIRLILADDPFRGVPHKIKPLLTLDWGKNKKLEITYLVTKRGGVDSEIYLLEIGPKDERIEEDPKIVKGLSVLGKTLRRIGVIILGREAIEGAKKFYESIEEIIKQLME